MKENGVPHVGVIDDRLLSDKGFIEQCFPLGEVEYPKITYTMLELGLWHTYISSTFLEGWINYVKPLAARLITRYRDHTSNFKQSEKFNAGEFGVHTRLRDLGDDVLLLAYSEINPKKDYIDEDHPAGKTYWLFWFDCDVSDCCIGRFRTDIPEDQLVNEFEVWAEEMSQDYSHTYSGNEDCEENRGGRPSLMLDPAKFKGWLSWI